MTEHPLYTAEQVRQLDHYAINECGLPDLLLMKRAGRAAFTRLLEHWPNVEGLQICCGSGNNGGDGYVIAALAKQQGFDVVVWSVSEPTTAAAIAAKGYADQEAVIIKPFEKHNFEDSLRGTQQVIVDALLGTGSLGEPRGDYAECIELINKSGLPVLAVDIPSGINADTGAQQGVAISAEVTVSMIGQKIGNLTGAGRVASGSRFLDSLGVPESVYQQQQPCALVLNRELLLPLLPARKLDAHKGDSGHVMVVGGDKFFGGAPLMAAQMAARTGAGLISVATQPEHVTALLSRQPEIMAAGIVSGQEFLPLLTRPTVLVVGPGLGQSGWSEQLLYHCLNAGKPLVIDADALNILAGGRQKIEPSKSEFIMTPHPGEAARLLGISIAEVQADRISAIKALQKRFGGVVVLKGAGSLVIDMAGELFVCDEGNPAMASGGMGDILSGLLGSLMAQGLSASEAAKLGVWLHSRAADLWVQKNGTVGLLATDLIDGVRQLLAGGLLGENNG